jgi:hypothetical protein
MDANERTGLAKCLKEAAEALFERGDAEAALIPICNAIDCVAADTYGKGGRSTYKHFISDRIELITRVASDGGASFNKWSVNLPELQDDHGNDVHDEQDASGRPLYGFQTIVYYLVRCKLDHRCALSSRIVDSGSKSPWMGPIAGERIALPLTHIARGLLFALLVEVDFGPELAGTVFDRVLWHGLHLRDIVGKEECVDAKLPPRGGSIQCTEYIL